MSNLAPFVVHRAVYFKADVIAIDARKAICTVRYEDNSEYAHDYEKESTQIIFPYLEKEMEDRDESDFIGIRKKVRRRVS